MPRRTIARLRGLLRRGRIEREADKEIQFHIEMEVQAHVARGMPPTEARRVALRDFGGIAQTTEAVRDVHAVWFDSVWQDLRHACRQLHRQPLFSVAIVVPIALGIAITTALFSVVDALILKPLPFVNADRLVAFQLPSERSRLLTIQQKRDAAERLEGTPLLSARAGGIPALITDGNAGRLQSADIEATAVTPGFFEMLGVSPLAGRPLLAQDQALSGVPPVVIGHDLWRDRFGGEASVLGQPVSIAGRRVLVVGVMRPGFDFPRGTNLWTLSAPTTSTRPSWGRLAPGVTIDQLRAQFPQLIIKPLREALRPRQAATVGFLWAATVLVLLVAWVQVAALQFARAAHRSREIGARLALGATRHRLIQQFAAEGITFALLALLGAWVVIGPLIALVVRLLPADLTRGQHVAGDARTLLFACVLSVAGAVLFTLVPLEIVRSVSPLTALQARDAVSSTRTRSRARTLMVVLQLAVTTILLYVTALAVRSFAAITATDLGCDPTGVVAVQIPLLGSRPEAGSPQPDFLRHGQAVTETLAALEALAGVKSVAGAWTYPLQKGALFADLRVAGRSDSEPIHVRENAVSRAYFSTLGIRVLAGAERLVATTPERQPSVFVNATLARLLGSGEAVIGQEVEVGAFRGRIAGVVADHVDTAPDVPNDPQVFLIGEGVLQYLYVLARADTSALPSVTATAKRLARRVSTEANVVLLNDEFKRVTAPYRARLLLLVMLAATALPLAATGVLGAMNYAMRQRTREIAIRIAMGAHPLQLRRRFMAGALAWMLVGFGVGLGTGVLVSKGASSVLFGVAALDGWSIASVGAVLLLTGYLAAFMPARRATRVDPAMVLRDE